MAHQAIVRETGLQRGRARGGAETSPLNTAAATAVAGFNGAAPGGARKQEMEKLTGVESPKLQRGRARGGAETTRC